MNRNDDSCDTYPKVYLYRRVVQAKLFIDTHYEDPIDLDVLAHEASFSKFHFIRLFKLVYQKTPHQYLKAVRLTAAKNHLQKGKSVSETCQSVGFESIASFSTLFKSEVGLSPSAYQQTAQDRSAKIKAAPLTYIPGCFAAAYGWKNSNFE